MLEYQPCARRDGARGWVLRELGPASIETIRVGERQSREITVRQNVDRTSGIQIGLILTVFS